MKNPFTSENEISGLDLENSSIKTFLPFVLTWSIGLAILIIAITSYMETIKPWLGIIVGGGYAANLFCSVGIMILIRAVQTEKGNRLKCLYALIRWALQKSPTTLPLFYEKVEPKGRIPYNIKNTDVYKLLQEYKSRIAEEKPTEKKKDTETKVSEQDTNEKSSVFVQKITFTKPEVGYDEQARIERTFQTAFVYAPGAPFTKHFPQEDIIEVPFGFAIITHGHSDEATLDCLGWTEDPVKGEWTPHLYVTNSTWYSIALRNNFKLPTINESMLAASYIQDIGDMALGLKSDLLVDEKMLNDLLERQPRKMNELIQRDLDTTHKQEKTIFEEFKEGHSGLWKYVAVGSIILVMFVVVAHFAGVF